jgi:4,5-dihydroxyphthalate decarboxylase
VPDYPMTAAVWMRIFLRELYEIQPTDIRWYNGRTKQFSHGVILGLDKNLPQGVSIEWLTENQTLDTMLDKGELDAAFGFLPWHYNTRDFGDIDRYGGTPVIGNPRIGKLFNDNGKQIIVEYYKKTSVLPSNHMFVVQNRILDKHPWVALELYKAFQKSKELAYERARRFANTYLLFQGQDDQNQAAIFGEDPYPLGIKQNRKMLELLFRGSNQDGLTKKVARVEEIFHPSTLDT